MARTLSTMLELGTSAPAFQLPDTDGNTVSHSDYIGRNMLVMFICNHCPYVKHVIAELSEFVKDYQAKGIKVVAISSNDVDNYPEDSPEKMTEYAARLGYPFPYLYDETQEVARAYSAACTPDFYIFDGNMELVYRGQLDGSRPGSGVPLTGADMRAALDNILADYQT